MVYTEDPNFFGDITMADIERAAELIREYWRSGDVIEYVKSDLWPDTPEEGYAIQATLAKLRNEAVVGWKIAATAEAGRYHINVDRPLAGRMYESIVRTDGAKFSFARNRMAVAEAEFAFTLGADLAPRDTPYTEDEVAAAIKSLHPGLELPDSRFEDFTIPGTAGLIADNACARHFVLGAATTESFDPRALADHESSLIINDEVVTTGKGADALGGPLQALTWLANTLSDLGTGLQAGQFVTTGVTGQPMPVRVGDRITCDLGIYGTASTELF